MNLRSISLLQKYLFVGMVVLWCVGAGREVALKSSPGTKASTASPTEVPTASPVVKSPSSKKIIGEGDVVSFKRFVPTEKASPEDWSFFKASSFAWKAGLWDYHSSLGHTLSAWHWAWRMAWVQACRHGKHLQDKRCQEIFLAAEKDKAVVVRAEVVRAYRKLFYGTGSQDIVMRLEQMFKNPHNFRRGRPLFIAKQILSAMAHVGGSYSAGVMEGLASAHPELASYYQTFHGAL